MVKVFFRTFGCPTNFSESEAMMGLLKKAGFELAESPEDAFVIVFNICTVKGNIVSLKEIRKTVEQHPNKKIVVAGCITQDIIPEIRKITSDASLIGTHNIRDIVEVVEETINDNPISELTPPAVPEIKVSLPRASYNPTAIIQICSGCTGKCSYCSVRIVKGKLFSYPVDAVLEDAQKCITKGAKQIWVTAQDTAAYMLDRQEKSMLPELINRIAKIPGNFRIRVGMMNINNLIPVIDEMIGAMRNEKVFKFLHLPVQSGSDSVLLRMKRGYTARQFKDAVAKIRRAIPEMTIATDMIAGFPGETKLEFQESIKILDELQPDIVNVSRFRPRPGTKAGEMEDQIQGEESKQRSKYITSIFDWIAYRKNKKWVGWKGEILIEEKGKEGTNTYTGRNYAYKPVIVEGSFTIGETKKVEVVSYTKYDLRAVLL